MSPHGVRILNFLQGWSGGGIQVLRGLVAGCPGGEWGFPVGEAVPGAFSAVVLPFPPEGGGTGPISFQFNPDLVLVSAGFDIYEDDPLGGMLVTPDGFAGLTRCVIDIAESCCNGKVVITLEGGYNLKGLSDSVKAVLRELAGLSGTDNDDILSGGDQANLENRVKEVFQIHGRFWDI